MPELGRRMQPTRLTKRGSVGTGVRSKEAADKADEGRGVGSRVETKRETSFRVLIKINHQLVDNQVN